MMGGEYVTTEKAMHSHLSWAKRALALLAPLALIGSATVRAHAQDLYVSDVDSNSVQTFDGVTGVFKGTFIAPGSGGLNNPLDLRFAPDNTAYVLSNGTDSILHYGSDGSFLGTFTSGAGFSNAQGFTFGPSGDVFVTELDSNSVSRYNGTTGAFLGSFVPVNTVSSPVGLTFGADNNLYVTNFGAGGTGSIQRYDGATGASLGTFASGGGLTDPFDLAFRPDGNLYVLDEINNSVLRYNATTGAFVDTFIPPGSGGLNNPQTFAFGPDGNLVIASLNSGNVLRYDGTTGAFLGTAANGGGLTGPVAARFGPTHTVSAAVPEPAPVALLGLGLLPLAFVAVRRRRHV